MTSSDALTRWPRQRPHLMICAAAITGVMISAAHPASARPARPAATRTAATRIAVAKIAGDPGSLRDAIADALDGGDRELVSSGKLDRTIDELGLDDELDDRQLRRLAAALDADAIIVGAFDRRAHKLRLTIFANRKKAKPFTIQVAGGPDKLRKLMRARLVPKLVAAVPADARPADASDTAAAADDDAPSGKPSKHDAKRSKAGPVVADPESDQADDRPRKPAKSKPASEDAVDDDARAATRRPKASDDAADRADKPPAAADPPRGATPQVAEATKLDDDEPKPSVRVVGARNGPRARGANLAALRVDLGTSMAGRRLKFQSAAFADAPAPYQNAPVPGARFEAELYPFAFGDPHGWLAGLGVGGDFDQTIALTLRASAEPTVPLKATERDYSVGVRYRLALGSTPTSPTLTFGAGYSARTFVVDRKALMSPASLDLPDVNYKGFDPGLAFRLPLGGRFAITLGGRALLVTSAGAIQRADQYGPGTILGATASAGVELVLGNHLAVRVAGEATQLAISFAGTGALATSRDGNAATIDVRGAIDRYYGGAATVAILY